MTLEELGWNEKFAADFAPYWERGWKPARLVRDHVHGTERVLAGLMP